MRRRKFTSPKFGGDAQKGELRRDPADKYVRTRKKIQGLCQFISFSP